MFCKKFRAGKILEYKIYQLNYDEDTPLERKAMDILQDFHQLCQNHGIDTETYFSQFYIDGVLIVNGTHYNMQEARLLVMEYEGRIRKICDNCFHFGSKIDVVEQKNMPLCRQNHDLERGRKGCCVYFRSAYYPSDHESFKEMKTPKQMVKAIQS